MRALTCLLLLACLASAAHAQNSSECGPGEYLTDITQSIEAGTAKVWLIPTVHYGQGLGKIWVYQAGRPEHKQAWGGGGPGSAFPVAFEITGRAPRFCVGGNGAENVGFMIYRTEPGA